MGTGSFKQPPKGPEIGPTHNLKDLPEEKQAEVGNMKSVFKTTEEGPQQTAEQAVNDVTKINDGGPLAERLAAQEHLEALDAVLQREAAEEAADLRDEAMPTDEDKQEFLRSVLGNRRYQKVYKLFDGHIAVICAELTPAEEDQIFSQLAAAQAAGNIETEDQWSVAFERLRAAYSVVQVAGPVEYLRDPDKEQAPTMETLGDFVMRFKGATIFRAIMQVSRLFRTQLELMLEAALSSDFWIIGGQDSQSPPTQEAPSTTAVSPMPERGDSSST